MASAAQQQDARAPACLLLLCGLPAAGKTTLARAMAQHAHEEGATCGFRRAHVCFDDYQQAGGSFEPAAWKAGRQQAWAQVAEMLSAAADGAAVPRLTAARSPDTGSASPRRLGDSQQPLLVIADDNMHLRSMRQQGRRIAAEHGAAAVTLYLPIQPEDAHARNDHRPPGARLPPEVMARMCQVFEPPDASEALTEDCSAASSPTLQQAAAEVLQKVQRAWGPPHRMPATAAMEEARAAGRAATAASASHQLDIASRSVLAAALAAVPGLGAGAKAALSRDLNFQRRCMLQNFRHGADDSGAVAKAAEQQLLLFEAAADDAVLAAQMTSLHEL